MKIVKPIKIDYLKTADGKVPFTEWRNGLDVTEQAVIDARLTRVKSGLMGDCKPVGNGVFEFKQDTGPGYRIYFGYVAALNILVILGGTKRAQSKDIKTAIKLWCEYKG